MSEMASRDGTIRPPPYLMEPSRARGRGLRNCDRCSRIRVATSCAVCRLGSTDLIDNFTPTVFGEHSASPDRRISLGSAAAALSNEVVGAVLASGRRKDSAPFKNTPDVWCAVSGDFSAGTVQTLSKARSASLDKRVSVRPPAAILEAGVDGDALVSNCRKSSSAIQDEPTKKLAKETWPMTFPLSNSRRFPVSGL